MLQEKFPASEEAGYSICQACESGSPGLQTRSFLQYFRWLNGGSPASCSRAASHNCLFASVMSDADRARNRTTQPPRESRWLRHEHSGALFNSSFMAAESSFQRVNPSANNPTHDM